MIPDTKIKMKKRDYVTIGEIGVWKSSGIAPTDDECSETGGMFYTRTNINGKMHQYVRYWSNDEEFWMLPTASHKGTWRVNDGFDEWLSPFVK